VASLSGLAGVQAPFSPQVPQFPEHAAAAAVDGDPGTAWLADPSLDPSRRWLQIDFLRPQAVHYLTLIPYAGPGAEVRAVQIAGRTFRLRAGANHLALGLGPVRSLRVMLTQLAGASRGGAGAGGIDELEIPGVRPVAELRPPVDAARALAGADLSRSTFTLLFSRVTGDQPFRRQIGGAAIATADAHAGLGLQDAGDAEQQLRRVVLLPAPRRFIATALVHPAAGAPDSVLDRLAGYHGRVRVDSSGRADGAPRWRGSRALDGNLATAWIAPWRPGGTAWLRWRSPAATRIGRLRLMPPGLAVRRPTRVRLIWPGGGTGPLPVGPGGVVELRRSVRVRTASLEILAADPVPQASAADDRAVGVAEIEGTGLPRVGTPSGPDLQAPCGTAQLRVGNRRVPLAVRGTRADFDSGRALRARGCGRPIALSRGWQHLTAVPGPWAIDDLALHSPAPDPVATAAVAPGTVLAPGQEARDSVDGVRLQVSRPAWLVLGEGYNRGWRASCDGRDLGAPVPLDGYANAWRVGPGCRSVHFAFGPSRLALIGYVLSAIAGGLCLLVLLLAALRRSRRSSAAPSAHTHRADAPPPRPLPALRAGALAVPAALGFGFVFGIRAGIVALPIAAVLLWRAVPTKRIILAAGGLLVLGVPLLYVLEAPSPAGGNHAGYAAEHLTAHWVAVAAFGLLALALCRELVGAPVPDRAGRRPGGPGTAP
jgi:hypothetical protein